MLKKVISGGQTGADIAGLRAAKRCGIETGGTAPLNYAIENGRNCDLGRVFGLKQSQSQGWTLRTKQNVLDADATLILAHKIKSAGTQLTIEFCVFYKKPYKIVKCSEKGIPNPGEMDEARNWLKLFNPTTLNIAGNRESKCPGLEKGAEAFLIELFGAKTG